MGKKEKKEKPAKASGGGGSKKAGSGLFLEKGEKLLIGVGGAGLVVLLIWGVMSFAGASSPTDIIKDLKSQQSQVQASITSEGNGAPPLPEWVTKKAGFEAIPAEHFTLAGATFEPIYKPDMLRENPRVLPVLAWQIDPVRGPMRSLDILMPTQEGGDPLIGVLFEKEIAPKDLKNFQTAMGDLRNNLRGATKAAGRGQQPPRRPQPGRGPMQPPGAAPPPPGAEGGGEGYGGDPYGYGGEFSGAPVNQQRSEKSIQYLNPREVAEKNLPLAETVYPLRGMLVQAVFPLKAQIEEIKRALRVQMNQNMTGVPGGAGPRGVPGGEFGPGEMGPDGGSAGMAGAIYAPQKATGPTGRGLPGRGIPGRGMTQSQPELLLGPGYDPVFAGFNVERMVITPSGEELEWLPYDHESDFFSKIRSRKIYDNPDNGYLPYFLRYNQRLAAPLPAMAEGLGSYPSLRLAPIFDAIDKLQDAQRPPQTESDWQKRFKGQVGDANPYAPSTGLFTSTESGPGGPGGPGGPPGFGPMPPGSGMEEMPGGGEYGVAQAPEINVLLLRFFDVDVLPGYSYKYRIQVKMKNPNFGSPKSVREPSDAKKEILTSVWVEIPEVVTYPAEAHLYAYDTAEYADAAETLAREYASGDNRALSILKLLFGSNDVKYGKEAVVQMQTWMPQVRATGSTVEPVGTWVVSEMPVAPGEYVGRRQLVKLPLWSSSFGGYVLRELSNAINVAGLPPKNQPKGWTVNFGTKSVLVDFEGGSVRNTIAGKRVEETSATELLILRPDGKLIIRNSAVDMADPKRKTRNDEWSTWIDRVETQPTTPIDPTGENGFGFGRPGAEGP